jgi:hypothetical protein
MRMLFFIMLFTSLVLSNPLSIAVIDFEGNDLDKGAIRCLTDRVQFEFYLIGKYRVLERAKMGEILKEQGFQQTGCTTTDCAVEIGRLINVDKMISGSIYRIERITNVTLRIIDVETGVVEQIVSEDCEGCELSSIYKEGIKRVCYKLCNQTIAKAPVQNSPTQLIPPIVTRAAPPKTTRATPPKNQMPPEYSDCLGEIRIVNPKRSYIYLDKELIGITNNRIKLPCGRNKLEFEDNSKKKVITVMVNPGSNKDVQLNF